MSWCALAASEAFEALNTRKSLRGFHLTRRDSDGWCVDAGHHDALRPVLPLSSASLEFHDGWWAVKTGARSTRSVSEWQPYDAIRVGPVLTATRKKNFGSTRANGLCQVCVVATA
jgi:hypothetical protein